MDLILVGIACLAVGAFGGTLLGIRFGRKMEKSNYDESLKLQDARFKGTIKLREDDFKETIRLQEEKYRETIRLQEEKYRETLDKVTAQLQSSTDQMLKQRQKDFQESSSHSIDQLLLPLKETMTKMEATMRDHTQHQSKLSGQMEAEIKNLMEQTMAAKESADELSRVFKHESKVQGDFGEIVLDELLTAQGLTEGIHYDVQPYIRDSNGVIVVNEDGKQMRPDVILHLDQKREVIIDSKVSMTAYIDYVNADNDIVKEQKLREHIQSVKNHVKELSRKDYSSYIQPPKQKMDYVIMFVPHSAALWTAVNKEPDLWRKAMEERVFIADEQTLFAAIKIIKLTWTQIVQEENHTKVYKLANDMLERVRMFQNQYEALGKALASAQKAYEDGGRKLADKGQSIITTCVNLEKLGAKRKDGKTFSSIIDIEDIPAIDGETK